MRDGELSSTLGSGSLKGSGSFSVGGDARPFSPLEGCDLKSGEKNKTALPRPFARNQHFCCIGTFESVFQTEPQIA